MKAIIRTLAAVLILFPLSGLAAEISAPGSGHYLGNLHIGKVQIHPELTYQLTYDTNINRESDNEDEDFIHAIRPGINLLYQGSGDNFLAADYSLGIVRFTDNSDSNFLDHKAHLTGKYETPFGLYASLTDSYSNTASSLGNPNRYNEGSNDNKHWSNTAALALGYDFNRLRVEAKYTNFNHRYNEEADWWQNRQDHEASLLAYYRFMPKTSATIEYRLRDINYVNQDNGDNSRGIDSDTSQDATLHQAFVGLHFDPTGKVQGDVKVGIGRKNYKNDEDWKGDDYDDLTTWTAETSVKWDATAKTSVSGNISRTLNDSTVDYATRFTTTSFGLGVRHAFVEEVVGFADAAVDFDTYDDVSSTLEQRKDTTYILGGGVEYYVKEWLSVGLAHYFEDRTSTDDFDNVEYTDNRTTLTVFLVY